VELGQKIKILRKNLGLNQTEFAKLIGVEEQSTISKWERGDQQPGAERSARLANLAGVSINEWLGLDTAGTSGGGGRNVNIVGELKADTWIDSLLWPQERHYSVAFPLPPTAPEQVLQGFILRGTSMNRIYADGSIILISRTEKKSKPKPGQRVLVIRRNKADKVEATLKEYAVDADGTEWLWPRSSDPRYQAPLELKSTREMDVTIAGVVMASISLEGFGT
jgi:transcriptional regulator with XRE-family HTH domain